MNPLIELYDKMMADPDAYEKMVDPEVQAESFASIENATPEQHKEFDDYVNKDLQAQLNKMNFKGDYNEFIKSTD